MLFKVTSTVFIRLFYSHNAFTWLHLLIGRLQMEKHLFLPFVTYYTSFFFELFIVDREPNKWFKKWQMLHRNLVSRHTTLIKVGLEYQFQIECWNDSRRWNHLGWGCLSVLCDLTSLKGNRDGVLDGSTYSRILSVCREIFEKDLTAHCCSLVKMASQD